MALDAPEKLARKAIPSIFDYVENPDKTENNMLITGYECFPELADEQFATAHELYEINTGRTQKTNSRLLYHLRQSFAPGEIDPQTANRVGRELALEFTGGNHMFMVATHTNTAHIHNHILVCAVNLDCNGKFKDPLYSGRRDVARISDKICKEYGLSVIEHKQGWRVPYDEWERRNDILPQDKPLSNRNQLEELMGYVLKTNPKNFEEFLKRLDNEYACAAKRRGNNISITSPFVKKPIRLSSLSPDFTEEGIKVQIESQQKDLSVQEFERELQERKIQQPPQFTPSPYSGQHFTPDVSGDCANQNEEYEDDIEFETADFNAPVDEITIKPEPEITLQSILQFANPHNLKLIIGIQNSLKAQNSIGYKRWCEKFNLEQMSQTLIFIERHKLTVDRLRNVAIINENVPNEIRAEIDTLDRKLENISELQRHLGTFNKTKHIHKQYRESPNPKQFWRDNEKALTAYTEASKYFHENGYGTWGGFEMPKFADTQQKYTETLAEKKKLWARYHTIKKELTSASNAWANVKTLLNVPDEIERAPTISPPVKKRSGPSL